MAIGLGKDEGLGHFLPLREHFENVLFELLYDKPYLRGVDHIFVELFG